MLKPIPKHLLIHTVTYEQYSNSGRYGETFLAAVTLKNVRVEFESSFSRADDTESKSIKALMFYDPITSSTSGDFEFMEKSKVTFNGITLHIQKVNPLYTTRLHHYEVELV